MDRLELAFLLGGTVIVCIIVIVLLVRQNSELKSILTAREEIDHPLFKIGESLPGFMTYTMRGNLFITDPMEKIMNGILFIYSNDCPHCIQSIPILNIIYNRGVNVVGLSLDAYPDAVSGATINEMNFPFLVSTLGKAFISAWQLKGTPVTIRIKDGKIADVWIGELHTDVLDQLQSKGLL